MDSELVSFEIREKYLLVIGHGKRDNLTAMNEASARIFEKIKEIKATHLLVDYRSLQINVQMNEAFNIVKRYEKVIPEMRNIRIAGVFSSGGLAFAQYWKQIALQRGFVIEIFEDLAQAEKWLLQG